MTLEASKLSFPNEFLEARFSACLQPAAPYEPKTCLYMHIYIYIMVFDNNVYIYIGSRLGVPRSFEEPSVLMLYQKGRSCIQMGGVGGVGGCTNVM